VRRVGTAHTKYPRLRALPRGMGGRQPVGALPLPLPLLLLPPLQMSSAKSSVTLAARAEAL
jgi:hypothetical protein